MAVIGVTKLYSGWVGTRTLKKRIYNAIYEVETDNVQDGPDVVLAASALPTPGDRHYSYGNDSNINVQVSQVGPATLTDDKNNRTHWHVPVTWETPDDEEGTDDKGNKTNNPLKFRDEIDVQHRLVSQPATVVQYLGGFRGKSAERVPDGMVMALCNSAMVPFVPPPEEEAVHTLVRYTKNMHSWPGDTHDKYINTVNSSDFSIARVDLGFFKKFAKHTCRVIEFSGSLRYATVDNRRSFPYWKVTIGFHIKPDGWRRVEPDRGYSARAWKGDPDGYGGTIESDPADGLPGLRRLTDSDGQPISEPVLFNGDGQPVQTWKKRIGYAELGISRAELKKEKIKLGSVFHSGEGEAALIRYRVYEERDLGNLLGEITGL